MYVCVFNVHATLNIHQQQQQRSKQLIIPIAKIVTVRLFFAIYSVLSVAAFSFISLPFLIFNLSSIVDMIGVLC